MGELADRRENTHRRIGELRCALAAAEEIAKNKASVYATGSFGRGEASNYSDLDLFIVGKRNGRAGRDGIEASQLTSLDEVLLKAQLIAVTRRFSIPDFSGDGRWLVHYSVHQFTETLGRPEDDIANTFTARLLLLLESRPLVGNDVYADIIEEVVGAYWRDYDDHKSNFMPAFLANDILRLWRTFCVNYEARTRREPAEEKAKGKVKNYKLKHSRILTCYSALLYLLAVFQLRQTVSPQDVVEMVKLSPTARLEWVKSESALSDAAPKIAEVLDAYERFLAETNAPENELVHRFSDAMTGDSYATASYRFGDLVYEALHLVGRESRFYRLLVV